MSSLPSIYDVYWADIQYEDNSEISEIRPAIIWKVDAQNALISLLKGTTKGPKANNIEIKNWQDAGLDSCTYVYIDKIIEVPLEDIKNRIGHLSLSDLNRIVYTVNHSNPIILHQ